MRVVERRDGDHVLPDGRSRRGVEAEPTVVSRRRDDDDAVANEAVRRHGGWILRPLERRADAHVHHVHAIPAGLLHGGEHDLGCGRADAAEDAIRVECHARRHACDAAFRADDAGDVGAVAGAVVRIRIGRDDW